MDKLTNKYGLESCILSSISELSSIKIKYLVKNMYSNGPINSDLNATDHVCSNKSMNRNKYGKFHE